MRHFPSRVIVAAATTVLLLGPACGGSDAPTAAEDEERARRIVLTSADLPGFTAQPEEGDSSPGPLEKCADGNPLLVGDNPRGVDGADFVKQNGDVRVQSGAVFAVKPAEAASAFSALKRALASQCLTDAMKQTFTGGAEAGVVVRDVTSTPLPAPPMTGESAASRLTIPLERGRERVSVYVDLTILRNGRVVGGVFTFQLGEPFPEAERLRLTGVVADRMAGKAKNVADEKEAATGGTTATTAPASAAAGLTRFRDPSGVTLEHPSSWTVEPSSAQGPLFLFLDPAVGVPFRRNVNVLLQTSPRPLTLVEYTDTSLRQIHQQGGATIGEPRTTTLSGSPAHRVTYRADFGGGERRVLSVWTVRGNKAWLVTYAADPARFDAGLPDVERFLATVQLPA